MKRVIRCGKCLEVWKTTKKVGDSVTCPRCGAPDKVKIYPYLMQREEKRHRRNVKMDLVMSILMITICLFLWTLSLPPGLTTSLGPFCLGAALFEGILALHDHFQANEIRQELDKSKDEEF